jgi:hypothetical protein
MKRLILVSALVVLTFPVFAQELYVNTEPASGMATHLLGIRLENQGYFNPVFKNRTDLDVMYAPLKELMVDGSIYQSDYYHSQQHFEGVNVYAKYRFLSVDSVQSHFRGAFFARASSINNPIPNQEISLEGDNSGIQGGFVFTRLMHKLALSGSASYLRAFNNTGGNYLPVGNARDAVAYTLSAGYLLLPKTYKSYDQVNVNLYLELLGKTNPGYNQNYLDAAPAIQFIFNSMFIVDLSYRTALWNNMIRTSNNVYFIRLEYNLFNVF